MKHCILAWCVLLCVVAPAPAADPKVVRVASKEDTETTVLGDIIAHLLQQNGVAVETRFRFGSSPVVWQALRVGDIDMYVDYTGTLMRQIFAQKGLRNDDDLRDELARNGVGMSKPLGFANNYAVGMKRSRAEELNIRRIADLESHPELALAFSTEFTKREDGWPGLKKLYHLPQSDVRDMGHLVAYEALIAGSIDATDIYTTDAKIRRFDLMALEDNAHFFPLYEAVILYRLDLKTRQPTAIEVIQKLEGRVDQSAMIEMNGQAEDRVPIPIVAADFIERQFGRRPDVYIESSAYRLGRLTLQHLRLVGISLAAALLVGIPLGILSARRPRLGQLLIGGAGVIQTIPALALLVFMIPLLKTGALPAIVALFLYSLLPIINNTSTGLRSIPPALLESANALGLSSGARLRLIELPMASASILTGFRTAAVINIGTATLGAFIGAGGYGQPIQAGLQLQDYREILFGAIPAAVMALVAQGFLIWLERVLVPRGLRLASPP